MLTYDFRLPPRPRTVEYAILAEDLGFRAVWCPEVPAFGHDIWVTLARIAEKTKRIKFGPSVLIPSYRHPMAQASAIAGALASGCAWLPHATWQSESANRIAKHEILRRLLLRSTAHIRSREIQWPSNGGYSPHDSYYQ